MTSATFLLAGGGLLTYIVAGAAAAAFIRLVLIPRLTGEKPVRHATAAERADVAATSTPLPGQALLYVARVGLISMMIGFEIELDGRVLASLKSPRFLRLDLPPGTHQITVGPRGFAARANPPVSASFDAQPGEVIVFTMSTGQGTMTRNLTALTRETDVPAALSRIAAMTSVPVRD